MCSQDHHDQFVQQEQTLVSLGSFSPVDLCIVTNEDSQQSSTHGNSLQYLPMTKAKVQTWQSVSKDMLWWFILLIYQNIKSILVKTKVGKLAILQILTSTLLFFSLCAFLHMLHNKKLDTDLFLRPWRSLVGSWVWAPQRK